MRSSLLFIVGIFLLACSSNESSIPDSKFEFFIQGTVNGRLVEFEQANIDNVNTSNMYFTEYQNTWLQAYKNGTDAADGYWTITIYELSLLDLEVPFTDWDVTRASVNWSDLNVVAIDDNRCGVIDGKCAFIGDTPDELTFEITSNDNEILEGTFSGKLYLNGIDFNAFEDKSKFVDVTNGSFRINYRIDEN